MSWTAVVPLKARGSRKSRLAPRLDAQQRERLSEVMAGAVLACLARCPEIDRRLLLSPDPPPWPDVEWSCDEGSGLNEELGALRRREPSRNLVVIHADLPLLEPEDVGALLAAAGDATGVLAPDRHDLGVNAVALAAGQPFDFAFGVDSFARCRAQHPITAVIRRRGLALDVDTPDDLDAALAEGLSFDA